MPSGLTCTARMMSSFEDAQRLGIVHRDHLPDQFEQLVGAEDLVGVQAAVDPDDRLAALGEPSRGGGVDAAARQRLAGLPVLLQPRQVRGTRQNRHQLRASLGGQADGVELHAVGLLRQLFPPALQLRVRRQEIVGADRCPEGLLRRGERLLRGDRKSTARARSNERRERMRESGMRSGNVYLSHSRARHRVRRPSGGPRPDKVVAANRAEGIQQFAGEKEAGLQPALKRVSDRPRPARRRRR